MELVQDRIYGNLVDEIELKFNELDSGPIEINFMPCQCSALIEHFATGTDPRGMQCFTLEVLGEIFTVTVYDNFVEVI